MSMPSKSSDLCRPPLTDDVQAVQPSNDLAELTGTPASCLGCTRRRSCAWVQNVNVDGQTFETSSLRVRDPHSQIHWRRYVTY